MSASITGGISGASPSFQYKPASGFLSGSTIAVNQNPAIQALFKASGVLADQCDLLYANTLALVASTPQTLDLTTLTDPLGAALNFARVRFIAFRNQSTTDGAIVLVGNSASNEWDAFLSATGTMTVFPSTANADTTINNSGFTIITAPNTTGMAVSGTHKTLKIDPGSNAMAFDVVIAGCHS